VDDVTFSHNGRYGVWHWEYLYEHHNGESSQISNIFTRLRHSVFDSINVDNDSKLCTWGVSTDDIQGTATG